MENNELDGQVKGEKPTEHEEIIELTEIVADASGEEDEIIDLVDVVEEPSMKNESEIIEESEIALVENEQASDISDIGLGSPLDENLEGEPDDDDFIDSLGVEIETEITDDQELDEADLVEDSQKAHESVSIHPAQLENALENVIKKMFSEKIESILVQVIEKAVTKELEKLKGILLEDISDN